MGSRLVCLFAVPAAVQAASLTVAAGAFLFEATDFYYPNFYTEAGFRGEIELALAGRHRLSLTGAAYPMDDNIFDPAAEYSWTPVLSLNHFNVILTPTGGFGLTKLQYPGPYFPHVDHQFLPWLRAGGDAGVGFQFLNYFSSAFTGRGRALYYLGDTFFRTQSGKVERWKFINGPVAELKFAPTGRWAFLGRVGWEFGGFYDDVFRTPEDLLHSRPYAELGVVYDF